MSGACSQILGGKSALALNTMCLTPSAALVGSRLSLHTHDPIPVASQKLEYTAAVWTVCVLTLAGADCMKNHYATL